jgi:biopolymer transport protein TolR
MAFSMRGRTQTALADINITPLVDVVLVLLLIFMLTAPVLQSGIEVAVPQTRTVEQITEQRTVITIDKDQNVFLNNTGTDRAINLADLANALGPSLPGSKRVVYIRADKQVQFGAFASVMDSVKQAGITNISIVTHPIENSSQQ